MSLDITSTLRGRLPFINGRRPLPLQKIARKLLPRDYSLSLVFCGDHLARRLNRQRRHKDYPANVLSFPLSKTEGEIFIDVLKAAREARRLGISHNHRIAHLVVHAILHLKGHAHSDKMDRTEQSILRSFGFWQK